MAMTNGRRVATAILGILTLPPAQAVDDLPGPSLQLSRQLTLPSRSRPVDETERALLRIEWKVAQSHAEEAAAVDDMLLRLRRVDRSVAQLRLKMAAAPIRQPLSEQPAVPVPVDPVSASGASRQWPAIAGLTALALLLASWRRRRRRPVTAATTFEPFDATQTAVLPGTPFTEPARTLAPPTIDGGYADRDGRMATDRDELPAPRADDQIPLELADVLVSMGLADGAARTLEEHIRQHPRRALSHWLQLLEIYRRLGRQEPFEAAASQLNQQFNIAPDDWQSTEMPTPAFSLEDYPHVLARLQTLWRRHGCADYLAQLLEDNRAGTRTGFPQPVVEEIILLQRILRG